MIRARTVSLALAAVLGHALAREVDRALGLVLRTEVEPDGWLREIGRALAAEGTAAVGRVGLWLLAASWCGPRSRGASRPRASRRCCCAPR